MNTKGEDRSFDIVGGPNKDMLFDACKYAYNKSTKVNVDFSVAAGYSMPVDDPGCACVLLSLSDIMITGIEHEDGSGDKFNLVGYCNAYLEPFGKPNFKWYDFKAYYNAKNRKGWITFYRRRGEYVVL